MLLEPVGNTIAKANKTAGRAIGEAEANFLLRPRPLNSRIDASAGEILLAASKAFDGDPFALLKRERNSLHHALRKARSPLLRARKEALALFDLADAIQDGEAVPPEITQPLAAQAHMAILGVKAGIIDGRGLANQIREAAEDAIQRLDTATADFRRFESAAAIATSKMASSFLKEYGGRHDQEAAFYAAKAEKLTRLHRKAFPPAELKRRSQPKRKPKPRRNSSGKVTARGTL